MLERNILIVDDNTRIKSVYIPAYSAEIDSLKNQSEKWKAYSFHLEHCSSMKEATEYLSDKYNCPLPAKIDRKKVKKTE